MAARADVEGPAAPPRRGDVANGDQVKATSRGQFYVIKARRTGAEGKPPPQPSVQAGSITPSTRSQHKSGRRQSASENSDSSHRQAEGKGNGANPKQVQGKRMGDQPRQAPAPGPQLRAASKSQAQPHEPCNGAGCAEVLPQGNQRGTRKSKRGKPKRDTGAISDNRASDGGTELHTVPHQPLAATAAFSSHPHHARPPEPVSQAAAAGAGAAAHSTQHATETVSPLAPPDAGRATHNAQRPGPAQQPTGQQRMGESPVKVAQTLSLQEQLDAWRAPVMLPLTLQLAFPVGTPPASPTPALISPAQPSAHVGGGAAPSPRGNAPTASAPAQAVHASADAGLPGAQPALPPPPGGKSTARQGASLWGSKLVVFNGHQLGCRQGGSGGTVPEVVKPHSTQPVRTNAGTATPISQASTNTVAQAAGTAPGPPVGAPATDGPPTTSASDGRGQNLARTPAVSPPKGDEDGVAGLVRDMENLSGLGRDGHMHGSSTVGGTTPTASAGSKARRSSIGGDESVAEAGPETVAAGNLKAQHSSPAPSGGRKSPPPKVARETVRVQQLSRTLTHLADAEAARESWGGEPGAPSSVTGSPAADRPYSVRERRRERERKEREDKGIPEVMSKYGVDISEFADKRDPEENAQSSLLVWGFPTHLPASRKDQLLEPLKNFGCSLNWTSSTELVAIFASPTIAARAASAIGRQGGALKTQLLMNVTTERRSSLMKVAAEGQGGGSLRPRTDASTANRLIGGALGIRMPKSKQNTSSPASAHGAALQAGGAKATDGDAWDL